MPYRQPATTSSQSRFYLVIDLVTCEYPPDFGGLADYAQQIGTGLFEQGYKVRVWAPAPRGGRGVEIEGPIKVDRCLGSFRPRDIWRTQKLWNNSERGRQILLQWSPTGYGYRAMNLLFPLWMGLRVLQGDVLRVMFHETFYGWEEPKLRHKAASLVQRVMSAILLNCSREVFVSTQAAAEQLSRLRFLKSVSIRHLPVPSNVIPRKDAIPCVACAHSATPMITIGHFGTFNPNILPLLIPTLEALLRQAADVLVLLIGTGSEQYRDTLPPDLRNRVTATGPSSLENVSDAIDSCDLMFQPYPEGVNTRRATAMAALAHGKLLVSTAGSITEHCWSTSSAIKLLTSLSPIGMAQELGGILASQRGGQGTSVRLEALTFYERNFALRNVLAVLANCYPTGKAQTFEHA